MRERFTKHFFGREEELRQIDRCYRSPRAELIVLYGRRRIGKSTLIQKSAEGKHFLEFDGLKSENTAGQIKHFLNRLSVQTNTPPYNLKSWEEVFRAITPLLLKGEIVVSFDELPWLACGKTKLIGLIKSYWDNEWSKNPHLTIFLCGSITSFMINQVVKSRSLYGRPTLIVHLGPLLPEEALGFFENKRSLRDVSQLLMAVGGVPKYLEWVNPNQSAVINLNHLFFERNAPLLTEFEVLFQEQFGADSTYATIVRHLAQRKMTQEELSQVLGWSRTGGLKRYLTYLENGDFICREESLELAAYSPNRSPKRRRKAKKYLLSDEYLRFYFTFVEPNRRLIEKGISQNPFSVLTKNRWESYCGLAFERLCHKQLGRILEALSIPRELVLDCGMFFWSPRYRTTKKGVNGFQLDMVIVRSDYVYTIIECKYCHRPVGVEIIPEAERKISRLKLPKEVSIEKVLIAAQGPTAALSETRYFKAILRLEDLFPRPE